jgi:hypothetical protein
MNLADHAWAIVIIGGPTLLAIAVLCAKLANRRRPARDPVSERGSRALYDRLDAEENVPSAPPADPPQPTPYPVSGQPVSGTQPQPNLSTEHQRQGDAKRPSDQLDRDQPPASDDGGRKSSFTGDA